MTPHEAARLIAMLQAAYRTHLEPEELTVYAVTLSELARPEVAEAAVGKLIRSEPRFPRISEIREAYHRERAYHTDPELEEAPLTEEQRRFNVQAAKVMAERMETAMQERTKKWQGKQKREVPAHLWTDNPKTWPEPIDARGVPVEAAEGKIAPR